MSSLLSIAFSKHQVTEYSVTHACPVGTVGLEKYSRPTLRDQDQDRKYQDQDQDLRSQDQDQDGEKSVSSALETKTAVSRTTSLVGSNDLEWPRKATRDGSVESEKNVAVILNFFWHFWIKRFAFLSVTLGLAHAMAGAVRDAATTAGKRVLCMVIAARWNTWVLDRIFDHFLDRFLYYPQLPGSSDLLNAFMRSLATTCHTYLHILTLQSASRS